MKQITVSTNPIIVKSVRVWINGYRIPFGYRGDCEKGSVTFTWFGMLLRRFLSWLPPKDDGISIASFFILKKD